MCVCVCVCVEVLKISTTRFCEKPRGFMIEGITVMITPVSNLMDIVLSFTMLHVVFYLSMCTSVYITTSHAFIIHSN